MSTLCTFSHKIRKPYPLQTKHSSLFSSEHATVDVSVTTVGGTSGNTQADDFTNPICSDPDGGVVVRVRTTVTHNHQVSSTIPLSPSTDSCALSTNVNSPVRSCGGSTCRLIEFSCTGANNTPRRTTVFAPRCTNGRRI